MRLSARQIELFQMAYRLRSTRKAAAALNVSQPAISRAVSEIEAEIGVQLFDRAGRKFEPTVAAKSLSDAILRHYHGLDRIIDAAQMISEGTTGHLRIVAIPLVADTIVARAAAQLMADHPQLRIDIDVMGERKCLAAFRSGSADCAVISTDPDDTGFACFLVSEINPMVAISSKDPLSKQATISLAELAAGNMVMLPADSPFRRLTEQGFETAEKSFTVRAEARSQSALLEFVAQGIGRAIVAPTDANHDPNLNFVLRTLRPAMTWPIRIVVAAAMSDAPIIQLFRNAMSVRYN